MAPTMRTEKIATCTGCPYAEETVSEATTALSPDRVKRKARRTSGLGRRRPPRTGAPTALRDTCGPDRGSRRAGAHDLQVEAPREHARSARDEHRADLALAGRFGARQRVVEALDHLGRQRVRLAVGDRDVRDAIPDFVLHELHACLLGQPP